MKFPILTLVITQFLFILFNPSLYAGESELVAKAQQIHQQAKIMAGERDEMQRRSQLLLQIYRDSNRVFTFTLAIAHLTLAIEKTSWSKRTVARMKKVGFKKAAKDLVFWGEQLREINRSMLVHLYFSYYFTKYLFANNYDLADISFFEQLDNEIGETYRSTKTIYQFLNEIHFSAQNKITFSRVNANVFTEWEHKIHVQPKLEAAFKKLKTKIMKFSITHVPNRHLEKWIVKPLMKMQVTFGLKCFKSKEYLRTKNFMNPNHRIKQALKFNRLLAEIDFDPSGSCFDDSAYISKFPPSFYANY